MSITHTPVGHDGTNVTISERPARTAGAGAAIAILLAPLVGIALLAVDLLQGQLPILGIVVTACTLPLLTMLRVTPPGMTLVLQLFGKYIGTSRRTGLTVIPFLATSEKVSVKVRNFETNVIKVNDAGGNPIDIAAIIVWQVADTAKASFAVESGTEFIEAQAESALRHIASLYPYTPTAAQPVSLSGSTDVVSQQLADEVAERVAIAGLEIVETRISALSYAPEIAQAMLQRQQAAAIVDARETIVEGAVSMVESALAALEERDIVDLDPERRAAMVSNLLVVLCSEQNTTPVVNAGSLYT
ncbi:band 7 protein [Corynebacterium sp. 13CS0277]|uniref:SPFH domain-containing protein n=1 Tax=Corynebacterium sp. 13CS0277 TaxID=2071994 RepID=UPI000D03A8CA|nr:SPFH domain-containing protein [Corynebacterium sp. 13CS0277]PRQ10414.1 band 7 protein [Corynebacterium sp. 13CS0277]